MTASAQLRIAQKRIQNAVFQAQKKAARELIQVIIDVIRTRTRLMKELANGSPIPDFEKKKSISKYVELRKKYRNNLDADTAPETSNATATGQMLNAMKGRALGAKITIDLKSGRRKDLNNKKSGKTNSQINQYYEEKKGEWFNLQQSERQEAIDYATEIIKSEIVKVLK